MNPLIEEFYNSSKYQRLLSLEQVTEICNSPFSTMVNHMNSDITLPDFRFKYLGCFKVSKLKVQSYIKSIDLKYEQGEMTKEEHERKIKVLNSYEDK